MASRLFVAALLLTLAAVAVFAPATAKPAAACSLAIPADLPSALDAAVSGSAVVIVGEVIHERTVKQVLFSSEAY